MNLVRPEGAAISSEPLCSGSASPSHLGAAGAFLKPTDDFRPELHDSDGLLMQSGAGEWIWRPLRNPNLKTTSSFSDNNPRGFGLMQRDRNFTHYEDLEARYDRGADHLELSEIGVDLVDHLAFHDAEVSGLGMELKGAAGRGLAVAAGDGLDLVGVTALGGAREVGHHAARPGLVRPGHHDRERQQVPGAAPRRLRAGEHAAADGAELAREPALAVFASRWN